jgi:replicative DNA helicase
VALRQEQLIMVAGPSGGGKSTFVQWLVAEMNLPTLYLAMDMEPDESLPRLIAQRSGIPVDDIRGSLRGNLEYFQAEFLEDCNIQFCFQENMSIDDVYLELDAYVEAWDAWPKVIVVDNLMDLDSGDESYGGVLFLMQELKNITKRTGSTVIVLAHTRSKQGSDYSMPQARDEILNKVDQKPVLILTLGRDGDLFRISPVKDRNSRASDPTGKRHVTLQWQGDIASLSPYDADWHRYNGGTVE